ncbi:MAG: UDP-N-acetylglucosamine 1-carboxyvinyltransferase [Candidatus Brocadiae bacterium]|nr:UDP-N-acetylglucosamine 1-carboxyvinyltransferase [Candidatus Brocadiia bacterium]
MERIVVRGGRPLIGTVRISGAKNAALPIMAAAILTDSPSVLHRVPRLTDVATISTILRALGVSAEWIGPDSLRLVPSRNGPVEAPSHLVRQMRSSICVLGPLLAMRGAARMATPGGCVIGDRPIDLHLKGLNALGARIEINGAHISGRADRLRGTSIDLKGPYGSTVLGTANVLMAAALAEGRTLIKHAACEPEVQDLARFLNGCGAHIRGIGTPTLVIEGVKSLHGTEHTIIPDRIEAGTFLAAAASTGGEITLEGLRADHLRAVIEAMGRMGVEFHEAEDALTVRRPGPLQAIGLATSPYPGLPTDMQPQLSALLCLTRGISTVREGVHPCRFTHVGELQRMGARIVQGDGQTIIEGVGQLHGAHVTAADLRGGAALMVAALAADGETTISGVDQIDRGYQTLEERLTMLGADISRSEAPPAEQRHRKSA